MFNPVVGSSPIHFFRLAVYVYKYLVLTGASKSAELFKQEKLAPQGIDANVALDIQPWFLQDWFLVFWDLYCASPDQRNRCESSWEAKEFHDRGFIPPSVDPYPRENGMNGIPLQRQFKHCLHFISGSVINYLENVDIDLENVDFDLENVDLDLENVDFDLENVDFDLENVDFDLENVDLDLENLDLDLENDEIGNYHHHHPGMSSHSAHPMHNGYYHPPSYMNHQPGPSHLNPPNNHSNRGRKRAKTEKPQERNFADSEETTIDFVSLANIMLGQINVELLSNRHSK
ncbi:single-stranded DNA-binding protein 3 [Ditylenchus destructor]|nr:single-stranded DNA-binding protein 3 [Ditylenchus destructor]